MPAPLLTAPAGGQLEAVAAGAALRDRETRPRQLERRGATEHRARFVGAAPALAACVRQARGAIGRGARLPHATPADRLGVTAPIAADLSLVRALRADGRECWAGLSLSLWARLAIERGPRAASARERTECRLERAGKARTACLALDRTRPARHVGPALFGRTVPPGPGGGDVTRAVAARWRAPARRRAALGCHRPGRAHPLAAVANRHRAHVAAAVHTREGGRAGASSGRIGAPGCVDVALVRKRTTATRNHRQQREARYGEYGPKTRGHGPARAAHMPALQVDEVPAFLRQHVRAAHHPLIQRGAPSERRVPPIGPARSQRSYIVARSATRWSVGAAASYQLTRRSD